MNGTPHVHKAGIAMASPFPHLTNQWYVVYGDQKVWFGANSWFIRSRNPRYWTREERDRRVATAVAKAVRQHDQASKVVAMRENVTKEITETVYRVAPPIDPWHNTLSVGEWPSDSPEDLDGGV